ncbi:MAG: TonB-dependent receptor, partial [Pyrinomonadaceae bacterium]
QFGRNIGAQVNAVSKSGGSETHGTIYGFLNSSQLNARNSFDTALGNAVTPLREGSQNVVVASNRRLDLSLGIGRIRFAPIDPVPLMVRNQSGGEDSFTLGMGGFAFGGPLQPSASGGGPSMFYFVSAEGQLINARREVSFAVPTVAQRGIFGTGTTSNFSLTNFNGTPSNRFTFPVGRTGGNAVFSLFPFANNPQGVYGANTFTQSLPAGAQGKIASGKFDGNFKVRGRPQSFTARYNFTDDWRDIPAVGGAIFSTLRPNVRAQNLSLFLNGEMTTPGSSRPAFNQLRASYGRTRLNFEQARDQEFLLPSQFSDPTFGSFGLLNAPLLENFTSPGVDANRNFIANAGDVFYLAATSALGRCVATGAPRACTTEDQLGPVGQIRIAGFSPAGVDVFNFPQRRVNNTYQLADNLTLRSGDHRYTFGMDLRRTELNSDLPRNARQLIEFNGVLPLDFRPALSAEQMSVTNLFRLPSELRLRPTDLVAAGAASGAYVTLSSPGNSYIHLRFHQLDFFAQDEWRLSPRLSLSYGLRYEFNTPPRETGDQIERTFDSSDLNLVPGLREFIDGRERIFDPDYNNFAPRVGLAYLLNPGGRPTVVRAGYGIFYDQILGAVVSQSRNVFPSFLTANFAGGAGNRNFGTQRGVLSILALNSGSPSLPGIPSSGIPQFVQVGSVNTFTDASLTQYISNINCIAGGGQPASCPGRREVLPGTSGVGVTLPARRLETPMAHHYSVAVEQQLTNDLVVSAAYVGTQGRKLLRFNTPNLGPNTFLALQSVLIQQGNAINEPAFFGVALPPGARVTAAGGFTGGRPVSGVGVINLFETTAASNYNSLQLQARARFRRSLQFQAGYTFSKAEDDVSDVFDLAGASALPQNSFDLSAERGPANFDIRHRFAYNFVFDFPELKEHGLPLRLLLGGLQLAGTGRFQTGQPFTVNSIFDVNLDGNLTDRLDTIEGIARTGDRRQPLRLTANDPLSLLAPVGQDGQVGRNNFRAGNTLELDLALSKAFRLTDSQSLSLRLDAFNFINRANYGVPIRFLEAPAFGQAIDTITPGRRIQIGLKYSF